jgi:sugar phosphate isomerase/epimerase
VKLGVLTVPYAGLPLGEALDRLTALGVEAVELGTGNYPGDAHCRPDELLGDRDRLTVFRHEIESRGLVVSALSQHGNPLHPDQEAADAAHEVWRKTVQLAEALEVPVVNAFSGCPGDRDGGRWPNWVTCAWPPDFLELLEWQWTEKVIPYWSREAEYAVEHGVRIGFEMHPGFVVYNPESLLRLRAACGDAVGANFDPSHLFWQGIDPVEAIKLLGRENALHHVHAKDVAVDRTMTRLNGVLDVKHYSRVLERSWLFRTVGYGHGEKTWRDIVSVLRATDYDYVVSIEHEDILLSVDEGLRKAVEFLQPLIVKEERPEIWWA